jgi:hypothetical protein
MTGFPETIVLGRDEVGLVAQDGRMRYYLTECCLASAKGCDGYVGCRGCYQPISDSLGGASLAPAWPSGPLLVIYGDGLTLAEFRNKFRRSDG